MNTNTTVEDVKKQVRRFIGAELTHIREALREGKQLKVSIEEAVCFKPLITFKPSCAS